MARSRPSKSLVAGVLLLLAAVGLPVAGAATCDPGLQNPIVCENQLPGNPQSEWDVSGAGSATIQGFATQISVDQGDTVFFKISTVASNYRIDIYRLGYYAGLGARKVASVEPTASLPQSQPACLTESSTALVDCGDWSVSASWDVPATATSGIYIAKLVREDGVSGASHIVFIVRDDDGGSELLFQTSDTTWQAYNRYGGNSLYVGPKPTKRAYKVSYNRPFTDRGGSQGQRESWLFNAEYPMVRWLEANGYDVSYFTGVDAAQRGDAIADHGVYLSVGHDEYWSAEQRAAVESALADGVNLAFFSGNEVFWKTRFGPSIDTSATPYRTLICYKETMADADIDPTSTWTGTWRDPRFSTDGGRPENAFTGQSFMVNGVRKDSIRVTAEDGKMRFWRGTSIASLAAGQSAVLPAGTLGYEWDEDIDNGFRPPGRISLSTSTVSVPDRLADYGSNYVAGTATHRLSLYRHPSGALVFGAGTVQWSWGLDATHDRDVVPTDQRMQQATVNLLADMGAQPATLQAGLSLASASTDATPPDSTIVQPPPGTEAVTGVPVTVSGSADDSGGGVVGAVEVSTDGGQTWHPAAGRSSWAYQWVPQVPGPTSILSRAVDDSGNLETDTDPVDVIVQPRDCPCSVWGSASAPVTPNVGTTRSTVVGMRFRSVVDGHVTGIRFYKGPQNTGTHIGSLWTGSGTRLGAVTFSGETASGWQQADLASPVAVDAGKAYVVGYFAPSGGYAQDEWAFATGGTTNWPLVAPADWIDGGNGVFRSARNAKAFPDRTSHSSNYWVDVVFVPDGG